MYDRQTTIHFIETRFPSLAADRHDEIANGLLHVQMGVRARFAQSALDDECNVISSSRHLVILSSCLLVTLSLFHAVIFLRSN
jgi:hypothetical protein